MTSPTDILTRVSAVLSAERKSKHLNNTKYVLCIMKEKLMTLRLPQKIDIEIESMASMEDTDKSKLVRELIFLGMQEKRLGMAIKLYVEGKITLWKAARLCDISIWRMMEIMKERKISAQYGEKELREDLLALRE